jgi:hypothetical protein
VSCDVEVVGVTIALESGPEGTTKMQARVQGRDLGENKRESGNNPFIGLKCKELNVIIKVINYTEQILTPPARSL